MEYSKIFENKLKTKIAGFFLNLEARAFSLGELEKKLSSRSLAAHLNALVKLDLLRTFHKRGVRYFILNQRNKDLPEWRSALVRAGRSHGSVKRYADDLYKLLQRSSGIKAAALSGLFCGNPEGACDLVLAGAISKRSLDKLIGAVQKIIGQEINYVLFDAKEYAYRKSIFDRFMKDIFDNRHLVVFDKIK